MDKGQRFIAYFLTGSLVWSSVPVAFALTDLEVGVSAETGAQLNLGQRIKDHCHRLNGRDRVRCVHEAMGNTRAKAQSRFGVWVEGMRDRMEKNREKFEERMKDREEKMENKAEKIHRKAKKISPEIRVRVRAEHKLSVEAARQECRAKETNDEKRRCMHDARVELHAKLKAMVEAALNQEE